MKRYTFQVELSGQGDNPDEAWEDAVNAFSLDPGDPHSFTIEDDEDTGAPTETADETCPECGALLPTEHDPDEPACDNCGWDGKPSENQALGNLFLRTINRA